MESKLDCDADQGHDPNKGSMAKIEENGKRPVVYIYRQDVVKSKIDGKTGVVTEVAGDSDSDSSTSDDDDDEDDEDEENEDTETAGPTEGGSQDLNENITGNNTDNENDDEENTPLPADHVRVFWMDESQSTQSQNDVIVIDRVFLHGDYVASVSDPTGQVGVVVDVSISVDLSTIEGSVINDVSSKVLKRVRDFQVGDYVILGPWLGRIDDVLDNVTVMFDDGSVCKVMKADPIQLKPVSKNNNNNNNNLLEDSHYPYYPGQRVKASSSSVFKNSRWVSGLWKATRLEGTVTNVTAGSVFVYWIASAGYGPDSSITPSEEQNPNKLKLLACFSHANWELGDWCLLPSPPKDSKKPRFDNSESDSEVNLQESTTGIGITNSNPSIEPTSSSKSSGGHESWPLHRKKVKKVVVKKGKRSRKKDKNYEKALQIINTRTQVDVLWQDGSTKRGLDSTFLIPIENPGDHEFVSEQYVVEKPSDGNHDGGDDGGDDGGEVSRVGVVKSVNAKERTACVRWLKAVARAEDFKEFEKEEVVSVYELEGHQDYDYCYGDVVVRLPSADVAGGGGGGGDFSDVSWVGNITGLRNGDIEVTWADGMVSMVGPQAIYVVGREDDDESVGGGSEVSDDAASWETVEGEDDDMDTLQKALEDLQMQNGSDISIERESENNIQTNGALSIPLAALGFMTRLASGIFSRGQSQTQSQSQRNTDNSSGGNNDMSPREREDKNAASDDVSSCTDTPERHVTIEESLSLDSPVPARQINIDSNESPSPRFKGFDIVKDPLDHYYLGVNGQNTAGRKWLKKVQQDWNILQNNLPNGIYVRCYENRMDLLRAVVVGAYGTPYQDGLFFFDFHLPPEYPDVPPSAYYHSGGWRINPNLYEEGKVCLSLLNTWSGKGNEVWDPKSSSILQVLVSLQGLVLNSKPYFNEAGYDKQVGTAEGEKNSLSYNENTFLLNCKTIMYLMRRPPKDFEELVREHFRERGYYILKACDAYMKGYLIGTLSEDASVCETSVPDANSVGFKLMLAKIVPKLILALEQVGAANCHKFGHLRDL